MKNYKDEQKAVPSHYESEGTESAFVFTHIFTL